MAETATPFNLNFIKNASKENQQDLLPVVVQDYNSKKVLLLAYLNKDAFLQSIHTKVLTLWSRSRNCLWIKGKTSGNQFWIKKIMVDCKQNSVLFLVKAQKGGICHIKNKNGVARDSCFYRYFDEKTNSLVFDEKKV